MRSGNAAIDDSASGRAALGKWASGNEAIDDSANGKSAIGKLATGSAAIQDSAIGRSATGRSASSNATNAAAIDDSAIANATIANAAVGKTSFPLADTETAFRLPDRDVSSARQLLLVGLAGFECTAASEAHWSSYFEHAVAAEARWSRYFERPSQFCPILNTAWAKNSSIILA